MLLTVSGLQGCDLVQGSDTAVDEVIKRYHCGGINKHGHMRTRTPLPHRLIAALDANRRIRNVSPAASCVPISERMLKRFSLNSEFLFAVGCFPLLLPLSRLCFSLAEFTRIKEVFSVLFVYVRLRGAPKNYKTAFCKTWLTG